MGHARGARALRERATEPQPEANVAQLAIQLGHYKEAERLYAAAGRPDLLNKLLRDCGEWRRALGVAATADRVHLRATHFAAARAREAARDVEGALAGYVGADSDGARLEAARVLCEARDWRRLREFVDGCLAAAGVPDGGAAPAGGDEGGGAPAPGAAGTAPNPVGRWYAQLLEAQGDGVGAAAYYNRVGDVPSLVRLALAAGGVPAAAEVVRAHRSPAAAYLLARHLEAAGDVGGALKFFEASGRFDHAVRLAAAAGREADLLPLALRASPATQLSVARSLEAKGDFDRAARLYHTGGATGRAIELCLRHGAWGELRGVAADLGANAEAAARVAPALLRRLADAFVGRAQYDAAVGLLVAGQRFAEAVDMVCEHGVPLTEALAEALSPPKPRAPPGAEEAQGGGEGAAPGAAAAADPAYAAACEARAALLLKLAGALKKQGQWHLACKKYTQAGDKLRAMKALLRSGDTEKVVFFAGVCRSRDIYVLAANYLQTLPWHTDPELLRNIIDFYGKAKAFESLAAFYEACAAVEIDEYRNYEKAAAALREAAKQAGKIKEEALKEARVRALAGRIALVDRFVQARKLAKTNTAQMLEVCMQLLEQRDAETAIRVGDVYALLIYFHAQQKAWPAAQALVEAMRARGIPVDPFIDTALVKSIYVRLRARARALASPPLP
jgi:intraflagellar transport protein 140